MDTPCSVWEPQHVGRGPTGGMGVSPRKETKLKGGHSRIKAENSGLHSISNVKLKLTFGGGWGRACLVMLRAYSLICAQGSPPGSAQGTIQV